MFFRQDMSQSNKTSWVAPLMLTTPNRDKEIPIIDTGAPPADNSQQQLFGSIAAAMHGVPQSIVRRPLRHVAKADPRIWQAWPKR
jgi:hypothetical protein